MGQKKNADPGFNPLQKGTEEAAKKQKNAKKKPELICLCNAISKEEILQAIDDGAKTLDEIFDRTSAGVGGCGGSCRPQLREILESRKKTQ